MPDKNLVLVAEFCLHHQVEQSFIVSLNEYGLIQLVELANEYYLHKHQLIKVEKIIRLHDELGINFEGIDAIDGLLQQIEVLQYELIILRNKLEAFG